MDSSNVTLEQILEKHKYAQHDSIIPILQDIQDALGYLPKEAISEVSKLLNIPTSKVFGLATFYNQFRFNPKGKNHIEVCQGTSCHLNGAEQLIDYLSQTLKVKPGQTIRSGKFSIDIKPCMGSCANSPTLMINGKYFKNMTLDKLKEIADELTNDND